eukprot:767285-Hanusia_phi.AAC.2
MTPGKAHPSPCSPSAFSRGVKEVEGKGRGLGEGNTTIHARVKDAASRGKMCKQYNITFFVARTFFVCHQLILLLCCAWLMLKRWAKEMVRGG